MEITRKSTGPVVQTVDASSNGKSVSVMEQYMGGYVYEVMCNTSHDIIYQTNNFTEVAAFVKGYLM